MSEILSFTKDSKVIDIDISKNDSIKQLYAGHLDELVNINLNENPNLEEVTLDEGLVKLTQIDIKDAKSLILKDQVFNISTASFNNINLLDVNINHNWESLSSLTINGCHFKDKTLKMTAKLSQLIHLEMKNCNLIRLTISLDIENLVQLDLTYNNLEEIEFNGTFKNIVFFDIYGNNLKSLSFDIDFSGKEEDDEVSEIPGIIYDKGVLLSKNLKPLIDSGEFDVNYFEDDMMKSIKPKDVLYLE